MQVSNARQGYAAPKRAAWWRVSNGKESASGFDDLAQTSTKALNGVGGVDHLPDLRDG
jgi:hypothetical protein